MKKVNSYVKGARLTLAALTLFVCGVVQAEQDSDFPALETDKGSVNAVLRTATIYVKDWDASIKFYTHYLGYRVLGILPIESEKSLKTIGAGADVQARIAYLKPNNSLIERPFAGNYLGLIELSGPGFNGASHERTGESSAAVLGEIVLAHQVVGIDEVYAAMSEDGIDIIAPLSLSGLEKSRSFSVIDPYGIRVEIYEFIEGLEPEEYP